MEAQVIEGNAQLPAKREPLRTGAQIRAVVPTTIDEVYRLAQFVCKAGLAPNGLETPEKSSIAIMHGLEIGVPPMQALQRICVINGRPTIWGDLALGLVRASGTCAYVKEWIDGTGDDMTAHCVALRRGEAEPITNAYSVRDAIVAGLWGNPKKQPWITNPKRMLKMRARGFTLRDGWADVLGGLYIREEMDDEPIDVTPVAPAAPVMAAPAAPPPAAPKAPRAPRKLDATPYGKVRGEPKTIEHGEPPLDDSRPLQDENAAPFSDQEGERYISDLQAGLGGADSLATVDEIQDDYVSFGEPRLSHLHRAKAFTLFSLAKERLDK